jgi:Fe-S-cluster containining protein
MESAAYDCQLCGACCVGLDVLLTDAEAQRFESDPRRIALTVLYQARPGLNARFMKRDATTDRCVALAGPLDRCRCTIYDRRPTLCREFAAGSPDCLEARRRAAALRCQDAGRNP